MKVTLKPSAGVAGSPTTTAPSSHSFSSSLYKQKGLALAQFCMLPLNTPTWNHSSNRRFCGLVTSARRPTEEDRSAFL